MARQGMDTSAVMKLYRAEPNSPQVRSCLVSDDKIILSELVGIEIISAANELVRQKTATSEEANLLIFSFEIDKPNYTILPFDDEVRKEAERLLRKYAASISLRPMDSFQLATALIEHRKNPLDSFITTDTVLIAVAKAEGLTVKP